MSQAKRDDVGLHKLVFDGPDANRILDREAARKQAERVKQAVEANPVLAAAIAANRDTLRAMPPPPTDAPASVVVPPPANASEVERVTHKMEPYEDPFGTGASRNVQDLHEPQHLNCEEITQGTMAALRARAAGKTEAEALAIGKAIDDANQAAKDATIAAQAKLITVVPHEAVRDTRETQRELPRVEPEAAPSGAVTRPRSPWKTQLGITLLAGATLVACLMLAIYAVTTRGGENVVQPSAAPVVTSVAPTAEAPTLAAPVKTPEPVETAAPVMTAEPISSAEPTRTVAPVKPPRATGSGATAPGVPGEIVPPGGRPRF